MSRLFPLVVIAISIFSTVQVASADESSSKKKIVFLAGKPSHGYGSHEHYAGCMLLAKQLERSMGYACSVMRDGYPQDAEQVFQDADAVVVYCDGGGGHLLNQHLDPFDKLMARGVGLGCIHYGVEVPKGASGEAFLKWIGGYFETHWSVNPHWTASFGSFPTHPVSRGVQPFKINDEWYFHMRFRPQMENVVPILSAHPPESTMRRKDGPHSGNPGVRSALARGEMQHLAWVSERDGAGRGFGFTGGHFHWNWGDDNFRKVVLNAIVWIAHGEVPVDGVPSDPVSRVQLEENQDYPKPKGKQ